MEVKNKEQAWKEANKLFPTDYEKDESASIRAEYDIYRHPTLNYYNRICDLGDRLEVLTGEHGENVTNIWVLEPEPKKTIMTTEEMTAQYSQPIIARQVHEMTFTVSGDRHDPEHERTLYDKLNSPKFQAYLAANDFVVAWCKINGGWGNKWGRVRILDIIHYQHGSGGGGHYCIIALLEEITSQ